MVDKEPVNCELIWREVSNYIDDEVDPALRSTMDAHFKTCPQCKSVLEGARNVIQLYGDERMLAETTGEQTIAVPAGYSRRLEKRLAQSARAGRVSWLSGWRAAWLVPLAAVVLIAVGLRVANSMGHDPLRVFQHAAPAVPPELQVVVATDVDGKHFHLAGCPLIRASAKLQTLSAKEALAQGFTPCPQCLRKYVNVTRNEGSGSDDDPDDAHAAQADPPIRGEGGR
jgi:anti-sigma factor RsiW